MRQLADKLAPGYSECAVVRVAEAPEASGRQFAAGLKARDHTSIGAHR